VVTNALLEGKGARTALVTTHGCRDVLELRRSARASLYDLHQDPPAVLVPRHLRLEVRERIDAQGQVATPPSRPTSTPLSISSGPTRSRRSRSVCCSRS
jgi:N-methylhydantoinase A